MNVHISHTMADSTSLPELDSGILSLRKHIASAEEQLRDLRLQLQRAEQAAAARRHLESRPDDVNAASLSTQRVNGSRHDHAEAQQSCSSGEQDRPAFTSSPWPLPAGEYKRYGRQMILPEIGIQGQLRLRKARALIVGVGGLGCPAAAYLAGAGVGTIGLVDGDTVETSNLHRQIAHSTPRVGWSKVDSAMEYLRSYVLLPRSLSESLLRIVLTHHRLNPLVAYEPHRHHLAPETALSIFEQYDLVLDCTDHPTSRYLISDACVLTGLPLVSASALKTEGQLIVLNHPPKPRGDLSGGPCYRCVFPKPPPADSLLSCGEGGILGPVVGVMGVLQALEAVKVLTAKLADSEQTPQPPKPTLLMFSAYGVPQFRSVRMRSRRSGCAACSAEASITPQSLLGGSLDYVAFCGAVAPIALLPAESRVTVLDFAALPRDHSTLLIDTRDETQYEMCALPDSVNIPWTGHGESWAETAAQTDLLAGKTDCYVVCRLGNDSQLAAKALQDQPSIAPLRVRDIQGGYRAWREQVDPDWPEY